MRVGESHSPALLRVDRVVVLLACLALGTMTLATPLFVAVSGMRTTGCVRSCDDGLVGVGGAVVILGCIAVTATAFIALVLLPRTNRYLWWLPCSALTIAIAVVLVGNHLIDIAVDR